MDMKKFLKFSAMILSVMMVLSLFSACGNKKQEAATDEMVDAAVKAALDAVAVSNVVTFEVDGKQISIEDATGKSIRQLLDQAGVTLNDGDLLTVTPDQMLTGYVTIQILRSCKVFVVVAGEDPQADVRHVVVLAGGTVSDAIEALELELAEGYSVNYGLEEALVDGMEIVISVQAAAEETEETEPEEDEDDDDSGSNSGSTGGNNGGSNSGSNGGSTGGNNGSSGGNNGGSDSGSDSGTENTKTIVSIEVYEDCDGSGHGVKVITYSDGTQEEVPF